MIAPAPRTVRILVTVEVDPDDDSTDADILAEVRRGVATRLPADVDLIEA